MSGTLNASPTNLRTRVGRCRGGARPPWQSRSAQRGSRSSRRCHHRHRRRSPRPLRGSGTSSGCRSVGSGASRDSASAISIWTRGCTPMIVIDHRTFPVDHQAFPIECRSGSSAGALDAFVLMEPLTLWLPCAVAPLLPAAQAAPVDASTPEPSGRGLIPFRQWPATGPHQRPSLIPAHVGHATIASLVFEPADVVEALVLAAKPDGAVRARCR